MDKRTKSLLGSAALTVSLFALATFSSVLATVSGSGPARVVFSAGAAMFVVMGGAALRFLLEARR